MNSRLVSWRGENWSQPDNLATLCPSLRRLATTVDSLAVIESSQTECPCGIHAVVLDQKEGSNGAGPPSPVTAVEVEARHRVELQSSK